MDYEAGSIEEAKQSIIDEFSLFDSWVDRYEYIVELGKQLPDLAEQYRTDQYKVKGCQSQVWFRAREEAGRIFFDADSDAMIVRGLIAILMALYDGRTAREILDLDAEGTIARLDLAQHLSPNRANGLFAMVGRIRAFAAEAMAADATA